ncbi:MAG: universal stress protein [Myxococcota bacterium]
MVFTHLVAGLDLTSRAQRVAAFAGGLAKDLGASLTFVHADPEEAARFRSLPAWEVIERAMAAVRASASQSASIAAGGASTIVQRVGSPEAVLQTEAELKDGSAIVLGTGATGATPDVGVTTTRCLRHVTVPMFIVPTHEGVEPKPVRHVLAPVDFERGTDEGLHLAAELAKALGAKLTVGHVVRPPMLLGVLGAREHEALVPGALRDMVRGADAELIRRLRAADLGHAHTRVIEAVRAADGIAALADEVGADLIVLPSHGRGAERGSSSARPASAWCACRTSPCWCCRRPGWPSAARPPPSSGDRARRPARA